MKWAYHVVLLPMTVNDEGKSNVSPEYVAIFDRCGQRGWELVCVERCVAYFKRPID